MTIVLAVAANNLFPRSLQPELDRPGMVRQDGPTVNAVHLSMEERRGMLSDKNAKGGFLPAQSKPTRRRR